MDDWYVLYEVQWDSDLMGLAVFIYGSVLCVVYGVISNVLAVTVSQGTEGLVPLELFLVYYNDSEQLQVC